MSFKIVIKKVH